MNTKRLISALVQSFAVLSLAATACGSKAAKPTTAAIVVPTKAPTAASSGKPMPTPAPTTAASGKAKPTAVPTARPRPTLAPATAPTLQPTASALAMSFGLPARVDDLTVLPSHAERVDGLLDEHPKAGNTFLLITLVIENTSQNASLAFDPAHFTVAEAVAATPYSPLTLKALADQLQAQTLKPGAKIEGRLAYSVPQGLEALELDARGAHGQIERWALPAAEMGARLRLGDLVLQPMKAERLSQSGSNRPREGYTFLAITLDVGNVGSSAALKFDPASLVLLQAPEGPSVGPILLKSFTHELQAQELKPGAKIEGVLVYEVPEADAHWELRYQAANNQRLVWTLGG